MYHVSDD